MGKHFVLRFGIIFAFCYAVQVGGQSTSSPGITGDMAQMLGQVLQNGQLSNFLRTNGSESWMKRVSQLQKFSSAMNNIMTFLQTTRTNTSDPQNMLSSLKDLVSLVQPSMFNTSTLQDMLPFLASELANNTDLGSLFSGLGNLFSSSDSNVTSTANATSPLQSPQSMQAVLQTMNSMLSPVCKQHIFGIFSALMKREQWALRMLDALGKPASGILDGNLKWMGSFDECEATKGTLGTGADIEGKYCAGHLIIPIPMPQDADLGPLNAMAAPTLTLGMCMPDKCSAYELTAGLFYSGLLPPSMLAGPNGFKPYIACQEKENPPKFTNQAIAMIAVSSVFALVIVVATVFDVILVKMNENLKKQQSKYVHKSANIAMNGHLNGGFENGDVTKIEAIANGKFGSNGTAVANQTATLDYSKQTSVQVTDPVESSQIKPGIFGKLLLSFSLYTNIPKLLSTKQGADSLRAVNGIRFLSMTWVILGHTYTFGLYVGDNMAPFGKEMMNRFSFGAIGNAMVSVDTFFTLSGLLVTYLSLKEIKRRGGICKFNWGLYYFHRFWRLTPVYMLFLGLHISLVQYVSDGPIWSPVGMSADYCKSSWWTNLLYVNNFVHADKETDMCMAWSWYLANDMQFFVLTPILLIPLFVSGVFGIIMCLLFLGATSAVTGILSYQHDYPANMLFGAPGDDGKMFTSIYIKPYCRMGPYLIGMITGYILYRTKCKIRMPKMVVFAGWLIAAAINLTVLYGLYDKNNDNPPSTEMRAFYNAVHRTAWAIGVCWVALACATGHGGFVNRILSWSAMVPLSRLTYCAYLVHPVVQFVYYWSRRVPIHFTDYSIIYQFLGHLVTSYAVAFCISLAFESPMMGLEKVILRKEKPKK